MKTIPTLILAAIGALGCGHSYGTPVVTTVEVGGQDVDAAWVVEDDGRIVRCTGVPEPRCRRVDVE